jgi:hypothetical protein
VAAKGDKIPGELQTYLARLTSHLTATHLSRVRRAAVLADEHWFPPLSLEEKGAAREHTFLADLCAIFWCWLVAEHPLLSVKIFIDFYIKIFQK